MSTTQGYTFPKSARLTSTKAISRLYEKGKRKSLKPLRYVVYDKESWQETNRVKVLVSVPKRIFKHAVDRNKLKRRIREAYRLRYSRLEKIALDRNMCMSIGIMYSWDKEQDFKTIDYAMEKIISNIEKDYQEGEHLAL